MDNQISFFFSSNASLLSHSRTGYPHPYLQTNRRGPHFTPALRQSDRLGRLQRCLLQRLRGFSLSIFSGFSHEVRPDRNVRCTPTLSTNDVLTPLARKIYRQDGGAILFLVPPPHPNPLRVPPPPPHPHRGPPPEFRILLRNPHPYLSEASIF